MIAIPKNDFIKATRELISESNTAKNISVLGMVFAIDPEVFNPEIFFSSQWFAENIAQLVTKESSFIEIGCGSGIVSINAARKNSDLKVYATDINPKASELTTLNANKNGVGEQVHVFCGDVFDGLPMNTKANAIFWAMPFGYLDPSEELVNRDWQVFDPGYRAISKFFHEASNYLLANGRLLIGFSEDIGDKALLEKLAEENGYQVKPSCSNIWRRERNSFYGDLGSSFIKPTIT